MVNGVKQCKKCGLILPMIDFYTHEGTRDGHLGSCISCERKSAATRYLKNKSSHIEKNKQWRINNPIKSWCQSTLNSHRSNGFIVHITTTELYNYAKDITHCNICGKPFDWTRYKQYRGGRDTSPSLDRINNEVDIDLHNIQMICKLCNSTKGERDMHTFVEYCGMVYKKYAIR